jgi:hypothetical protein
MQYYLFKISSVQSNSFQLLPMPSARACFLPNPFISFEAIHTFFNQSAPEQIGKYKLSLLLQKNM